MKPYYFINIRGHPSLFKNIDLRSNVDVYENHRKLIGLFIIILIIYKALCIINNQIEFS